MRWGLPGRHRSTAEGIRRLASYDTDALRVLVDRDPVANAFVDSQLQDGGTAAGSGGALYLGRFDGDELRAACWVGSNVVPVECTVEDAAAFGRHLLGQHRRFASVFGPREATLGLWSELSRGRQRAFSVREHQPLMVADTVPQGGAGMVRRAWPADGAALLPACVAMFQEELGYSPFTNGEASYRQRVDWMVRTGHALVEADAAGRILFKAELGVVTPRVTQIQGVWMHPDRRGMHLAESRMADVIGLALEVAPTTSLYVNDYNERALRTYRSVGFRQVGEFATVLF
jgi:ribosomal protein S18 acetylase RimI-like enzyme